MNSHWSAPSFFRCIHLSTEKNNVCHNGIMKVDCTNIIYHHHITCEPIGKESYNKNILSASVPRPLIGCHTPCTLIMISTNTSPIDAYRFSEGSTKNVFINKIIFHPKEYVSLYVGHSRQKKEYVYVSHSRQ